MNVRLAARSADSQLNMPSAKVAQDLAFVNFDENLSIDESSRLTIRTHVMRDFYQRAGTSNASRQKKEKPPHGSMQAGTDLKQQMVKFKLISPNLSSPKKKVPSRSKTSSAKSRVMEQRSRKSSPSGKNMSNRPILPLPHLESVPKNHQSKVLDRSSSTSTYARSSKGNPVIPAKTVDRSTADISDDDSVLWEDQHDTVMSLRPVNGSMVPFDVMPGTVSPHMQLLVHHYCKMFMTFLQTPHSFPSFLSL